MRFLEDIAVFRQLYLEKGVSWRRTKTRLLYETYFRMGAPLELNISSALASALRAKYERAVKEDAWRDGDDIINDVAEEVRRLVQHDVWTEFALSGGLKHAQQRANELPRAAPALSGGVAAAP